MTTGIPQRPRLVAAFIAALVLATAAPAAGPDDLSRDRAIKTAARAAAQEALNDLLKADDFRVIELLPRRWETRLDDYMARQLMVLCLRRLNDTGKLTLKDPATVVTTSQVMAAGPRGVNIKFGQNTVDQDIFTINGRCAWAIEHLLGTGRDGYYYLHFEPLDQKPFLDREAMRSGKMPRAEFDRVTSRWQRVVITEQLNADPAKLEDAIDIAQRAIVQGLRMPAKLRKRPDDPKSNPDGFAREALDALLSTSDYPTLRSLPKKWTNNHSETTLKHLILRLLDRLGDPEEVRLSPAGFNAFIMSHFVDETKGGRISRTDEMLEQDITVTNGRCAWALERLLGITLPSFDADLVKDKRKLRAAIREAHCRVIEAMELPEKPWVKKFREE
ncbi:MAG TPA: hypothetical protein VG406_08885 [Isosphaeraceae bacterium]|jgi:hypothetical protein|nr:hypothetical protein [Isosphaeraceae bacterium]